MSSIHLLLNRSATINIATILVTGIFTTITTTALTYTIHNFYCYSTICSVNNL